jgi:hypothetical protein
MAVLSWQTPSFSFFLRIGAEPQTFPCVGLAGRPAQIETGPVNLLGSIRRLWLVGLGRRLRQFLTCCLDIRLRAIIARWATIGRVVLVFVCLDTFSVQALSGPSLRLVSIAEDIVLSHFLVFKLSPCTSSTDLSCCPDYFRCCFTSLNARPQLLACDGPYSMWGAVAPPTRIDTTLLIAPRLV